MEWLKKKIHHNDQDRSGSSGSSYPAAAPPAWAPAAEESHDLGLYSDAPEDEVQAGEDFCERCPLERPRLLPSDVVERIEALGCRAWGIERPRNSRFVGSVGASPGESKGGPAVVRIETVSDKCRDTCLLSDLPLSAGLYDTRGKAGVYYEITIHQMMGTIALGRFCSLLLLLFLAQSIMTLGTACRPYPDFRQPGWNRLSAALHLDDLRKFFENPDGGMDYDMPTKGVGPGDVVGCGLDFESTSVFFTYNGARLANAFSGAYVPRVSHDVYAAIGVFGGPNTLEVNFGGEPFRWKAGNEWAWRVEGHIGRLGTGPLGSGGALDVDEELPSYSEVRNAR